jgi:hypothetical protein
MNDECVQKSLMSDEFIQNSMMSDVIIIPNALMSHEIIQSDE